MMGSLALLPLLHIGASLSWTSFTVHWSTVVGLGLFAALYEWRASRAHSPFSILHARRSYLYAGLAVIFLSLNGWLHDLSDYYLFSAHMVQHLLLALVVAPLLIMATPGWMLRPALAARAVASTARWLTNPLHSFALFTFVLAAWHVPPLYNLP